MIKPFGVSVVLCILALACGGKARDADGASATVPPAAGTNASSGRLVGPEFKAQCGGFGVAQAAEILGAPAGTVTEQSQDITPISRVCGYVAGDKHLNFTLTLDESIAEAKHDLENMREAYTIAARARVAATGKTLAEGAYSDVLGVGDDAVWSVTNTSLVVRDRNLLILVMSPDDKKMQVAIAERLVRRR